MPENEPMTITEFLLARIAEDEADARERPSGAHIHESGCYYYNYSLDSNWFCDCDEDGNGSRRLLAECAAKRAIIELAVPYLDGNPRNRTIEVLHALAAVYADHPDYRQEWAA